MNLNTTPQFPVADDAAKAATGKTLSEWFAAMDEKGGLPLGRRELNVWLFQECKVDAWWTATLVVEYENHKGAKEKDGLAKGYFICSTKTVNAPVDQVYAAWASSEGLDRWLGAEHKGNVVDGGQVTNADGDQLAFKRVRANKDLRFTYHREGVTDGSIVDVQFQDKGNGKTGLLVNHDRIQTRGEADGLREAWGQALDRLKKLVEAG